MFNKLIAFLGIVAISCSARAETVYRNTFDDLDALSEFDIYGENFSNYTPPPLHEASIDAGQLRIDTTSIRPNGEGTSPVLVGRATLALNTSDYFDPAYNSILSGNHGVISWSFNVANQDGEFNNGFDFILASSLGDAHDIGAFGYALRGGGSVGSRLYLSRFDYGLGGGESAIIDIGDGLSTLPEMGSFRITYNPSNDVWSLYGETGLNYTNPVSVNTLLGTAVDTTYTNIELDYFGLSSKSTGTAFFDNVSIQASTAPIYSCVGFSEPFANGAVKVSKNRVLPFKAKMIDENNQLVYDYNINSPPVIQVTFDAAINDSAYDVSTQLLSSGHGTDGNQFEFSGYDWRYNLNANNFDASGTYTVTMVSGDEREYVIGSTCTGTFVID